MRIIAGTARGVALLSPKGKETTRPMLAKAREALFNILSQDISQCEVVLDLFAGTGALGLEALSRGTKQGYFVEKSSETFAILQKNVEKCRFKERVNLFKADAFRIIPTLSNIKFDLIFFDPPYHYFDNPITRREILEYLNKIVVNLTAQNAWIVTHYRRNALAGMPLPAELYVADKRDYGTTELLFIKRKSEQNL